MKKTDKLFERYFQLLNEQEPAPEADPAVDPAAAEQPAPPVEEPALDENQKYLIKVLTHAFIFNPTLFSRDVQAKISNDIKRISKSVNVPIAKTVEEITNIICMDNSLCRDLKGDQKLKTESKTLRLINKMLVLLEQPADATEPQAEDAAPEEQGAAPQAEQQPEVEKPKSELSLEEIFPLYRELIMKALAHTPSDEELMMLKPVVDEFADVDPTKIETFIAKTLNQSLQDNELEDNLSELDSPTEEIELD
jgi:hypothetical protein